MFIKDKTKDYVLCVVLGFLLVISCVSLLFSFFMFIVACMFFCPSQAHSHTMKCTAVCPVTLAVSLAGLLALAAEQLVASLGGLRKFKLMILPNP